MMSSTIGAVKEAYTTLTGETAKSADLARDTINLGNPPHFETDGRLVSKEVDWHAQSGEAAEWKKDFIIKPADSHNLQRDNEKDPEALEATYVEDPEKRQN